MELHMVPITETLHEVRGFLEELVGIFCSKYSHTEDYDECLSVAYEGFMDAYLTYDLAMGTFENWLGFKAWTRLLSHWRMIYRHRRKTHYRDGQLMDKVAKEPSQFNLQEFLEDLGSDARIMAQIALRCPWQVEIILKGIGRETPYTVREAIKHFLLDAGWTAGRVKATIEDIRRAL